MTATAAPRVPAAETAVRMRDAELLLPGDRGRPRGRPKAADAPPWWVSLRSAGPPARQAPPGVGLRPAERKASR